MRNIFATLEESKMYFKVFAGNMYCGMLLILGNRHFFINRNNQNKITTGVSDKVKSYKRLRLVNVERMYL